MEKAKTPQIRFKGYTDAWEQRELGELGSVAMNKRVFKHQTTEVGDVPFYKIGTFGETPDAFITRELFEEFRTKYQYPQTGDILISASGSIGRMVEYCGEDAYFQDSNIVWLKHGEKIDNVFLKCFYTIVKWEGLEGSTIKRLYNKNILETKINYPIVAEQTAIGTFFATLDNLITCHQRKCDKLINIKKSLLEKMFLKNGESVPEIRFAGFTDAWEQREFGSSIERVTTVGAESELPRVEYEDIIAGRGILNNDITQKVSEKVGIKFSCGDILYGKLRPYLKNWLIADFEGIAVGDFWIYRMKENDEKFIYSLIQTTQFQLIANQSAGSKMPRADWGLVSKAMFSLPCDKQEQTQIGTFFQTLDNLITCHQRELEKLKNIKKSLLEKMFV